ncbi:MAG TPA: helix-turn-helix domain-containing protein [Cytophagaceae bacterium]|jgi:AraC-like DNA-binding protein/quercetin dioxygenase-like cupin family protein
MEKKGRPDAATIITHHINPPQKTVAFRLVNLRTYLERHERFLDHRHGFFELIFIVAGSGIHTIDFIEYIIQPNTLFLISPGQVHNFQKGIIQEGFVLIFDRDYFAQHQSDNEMLMHVVACGLQRPQISVVGDEVIHISNCKDLIDDELKKDTPDYEIVRSALKIMLLKALHLGKLQIDRAISKYALHKKQYLDFMSLIESHHTQRHEVGFYAAKLMISPKQLTVITRSVSGKTALQTIHDRVLIEAKRLLYYSELSVKEIAVALGFDDASYFSRFFVQKSGVTAKEFQMNNPKST